MRSVELFVILAVAAFDLTVVPGGVRTDELVSNAQFLQRLFKKGLASGIGGVQAVGEFGAVICLNAFNGERKLLDHMAEENSRRVSAVLFKGLQIAKPAELIKKSVLIPLGSIFLPDYTGFWDELDVDLASLPGILHLFIRLGDIFGIWQLNRHLPSLPQKAVQPGDGAGIPFHPQLHPEYHQTRVGIPAPHVVDELDLFLCMLVRVTMRPMGPILQGLERSIVAFFPPVDVLPVCAVSYGCLCYPIFLRVF